ncbi:hypothetical protein [Streptomyces brasiliscabiei]|uniref:hypothetical protein n=1 Tax=Streptomyces brasiliscabiei TaxID=2736302 RepID=UPI001C0F772F|nr:hypothetical protein [Streptomyces brasiliscabiei]
MQRARTWVAAGVLGMVLCGCSSVTGGTGTGDGKGSGSNGGSSSAGAAADAPEVPVTTQDLERVCTDGLGFEGLPAYDRKKKTVHPAQLMNSTGDGWTSSVPLDGDFPKGWFLGYDDKPEQTELVVCVERTKATATGKVCDMEADGKPLKIKTYNTSYRLRVVEARTGKEQYAYSGKVESDECPVYIFTSDGEDADKYYNEVRSEDYRGRVKPYIAP